MASLIKKIASTVDRIPEGIERAQATIQGTRTASTVTHTPFFRLRDMPSDQEVLPSPVRMVVDGV
jgi:hypothetical protein